MSATATCPFQEPTDERKSAALAAAKMTVPSYAVPVRNFALARDILRNPSMVQDIELSSEIPSDDPEQVPVVFLEGDIHRRRRSKLARFFSPKAINRRHRAVMDRTTAELLAEFRRTGRAQLDLMSMQLACDVAAEIVGLTNSDRKAMAERIRLTFKSSRFDKVWVLGKIAGRLKSAYKAITFLSRDVRPAIKARQQEPQDDIISYLIEQDYSEKSILIECMTYATAGMLTTREFIVMVAWYLFDREDIRRQFLEGDEATQFEVLEEILRLEPVAAFVYRRAQAAMTGPNGETIEEGQRFALDIRATNTDVSAGACPYQFDLERARRERVAGAWLSFGDGAHRCPGAQVALHETRVFIDALFRLPGVRLAVPPSLGWCHPIAGYELHGAIVACDPA